MLQRTCSSISIRFEKISCPAATISWCMENSCTDPIHFSHTDFVYRSVGRICMENKTKPPSYHDILDWFNHKFSVSERQRGMEHLRWLCIIVRWLALKMEPSKHHGYRVLGSIGDTFCVDLVVFGDGPYRAKTGRHPLRLPLFWCAYFIFYAYVGYIRFAHTKFQLNNSSDGNNWQHQQQQKKQNSINFWGEKTLFDIVTLRREKQWRAKWDHSTTNTLACAQCYFLMKILVYACVCASVVK